MDAGPPARAHPDAARAWLDAMAAPPAEAAPPFAPATLKGMLDGALALGRYAGRLDAAMGLVGEIERRLAEIAAHLDIDRRRGTVAGRPAPGVALIT